MVVIRLTRVGKKNSPAFRLVVADKQRAVKRKFIEVLGHYNPQVKPKEIVIDKERVVFWLGKGARPSDTVNNLLSDLDIIGKDQKRKIVYGKAKKKKELKAELAEGPKMKIEEKTAEKVEENGKEETPEKEESQEVQAETEKPIEENSDKDKNLEEGSKVEETNETEKAESENK